MMAKNTRYKALLGTVLALCLCACQERGCGKHEKVARLIEISGGIVQQNDSNAPEVWEKAELGHDFVAGDGLRTQPQSAAIVQLSDDSQLSIKPGSTVRFLALEGSNQPSVELVSGEAVIQAGATDVQLHTHVGLAILKPGAKVQLIRAAGGTRVHLEVGEAMFRTLDGVELKLSTSQDLRLEIGAAVIREAPLEAPRGPEPDTRGQLQLEVMRPEVRARAKGQASLNILDVGKLDLAPGTELLLSASATSTLLRDLDRVHLSGGE